ncbi:porin [Cobetia crustatorum]|nr:porin [Cobetia crustatorum]
MHNTTKASIPTLTLTPSRLRRIWQTGLLGTGLLAMASPSQAFDVYKTDTDRVEFSGRLSAYAVFQDGKDDEIYNGGSRVRLIHEHQFQQGWSSIIRAEWGVDPWFKDGTDAHYKRMLYAGVAHDKWGRFTAGKQYGPWYDMIAVNTDWFWINGGEASGTFEGRNGDGGLHGTGRPDNSLYWKKDFGQFTTGVMYQLGHDGKHGNDSPVFQNGVIVTDDNGLPVMERELSGYERDYSYETALNWQPNEDVTIGGVYHHTELSDYDNNGASENGDIDAWLLGGHWSPGNWYIALVGGEYRNHIAGSTLDSSEAFVDKARGVEFITHYSFKNLVPGSDAIEVYAGLNHLKDTDSEARYAYQILGSAWLIDDFVFSAEYRFDNSRQSDGSKYSEERDQVMVLARYDF